MLKFDKTVNSILNRLIFEQDERNTSEDKNIENAIAEIERKYKEEGGSFQAESEEKFNSGQEYVNSFIQEIQKLPSVNGATNDNAKVEKETNDTNVNESSFTTDISNAYDYVKNKGKQALDYVLPAISKPQEFLADLAVENMDKVSEYVLGKDFAKELNDNISENLLYKAVAIFFDPTGVLSWPYLKKATDLYEQHKGTEDEEIYQLNLLAAQISVIPSFAFKPIFGILTLPFRILFGSGAKIAEKVFGAVGVRKVARGLANWIKKPLAFNPRVARVSDRLRRAEGQATRLGKAASRAEASALKGIIKRSPKVEASLLSKGVSGKVLAAAKGAVKKVAQNPIKSATVASSGDIPQAAENIKKTLEAWREKGSKMQSTPRASTLGQFPSFNSLSTQSF